MLNTSNTTGTPKVLGHDCVPRLIQRNLTVAVLKSHALEYQRAQSCTLEAVSAFYTRLDHLQKTYQIQHQDIWNMDEICFHIGPKTNTLVIEPSNKKHTTRAWLLNRAWVSLIGCISADIGSLDPVGVFKGKSFKSLANEQQFVIAANTARILAMTQENIRSGFRSTDIAPFNPSKGVHSYYITDEIQEDRETDVPATPPCNPLKRSPRPFSETPTPSKMLSGQLMHKRLPCRSDY